MSQLSSAYCPEHKEQFKNFCCAVKCLKPLCPECIEEHQKYHLSRKEATNQIDSIKNIKQHQQNEISTILLQLEELLEHENEALPKKNQNDNYSNQVTDTQLNQAQETLIKEINNYFQILRSQLSSQNSHHNYHQPNHKFEKYKSMSNELQIMQHQLYNDTNSLESLNWLKNICQIDFNKLKLFCLEEKQNVQGEIYNKSNIQIKDNQVTTNWEVLRAMTLLLPKYCYLDDGQNMQNSVEFPLAPLQSKNNEQESSLNENSKMFVPVQLEATLQAPKQDQQQDQNDRKFAPVQLIVPKKDFFEPEEKQEQFEMDDDQESSEIQLQSNIPFEAYNEQQQLFQQFDNQLQQFPNQTQRMLQFTCKNYFLNTNIQRQFLHYFLPTNDLILYNLAQIGVKKFQKIRIPQTPQQQKIQQSICVPNGDIYAFTSNQVFQFILETKKWIFISSMLELRENFGVGYVDGFIYIIGGKGIKTAERLNLKNLSTQTSTQQAGTLKFNEPGISVCGGWGRVYSVNPYCIETCKINDHIWTQFLIQEEPIWGKFPGCICVTEGQLMVFGGEGERSCSVVGEGWARHFGEENLPVEGAFQNNCCVVQGHLYAMKYVMKLGKALNYLLVYDREEGGWTLYD